MSYSHDFEFLKNDWMAQNMSYTYDFETHKNLSHKQSVLFYGHPLENLLHMKNVLFYAVLESSLW